jgi:hypothetical protein
MVIVIKDWVKYRDTSALGVKLPTLSQSKYPCIYAVAFILLNGEPLRVGLPYAGFINEQLEHIERDLEDMSLSYILAYTSSADAPVAPRIEGLHTYFLAVGLVE